MLTFAEIKPEQGGDLERDQVLILGILRVRAGEGDGTSSAHTPHCDADLSALGSLGNSLCHPLNQPRGFM